MINKSVAYEFAPAKPEEANYRIDYRFFKTRQDFEDYKALFEDCGWTHVAGKKSSGAQYFKQTGDWGDDDIFSDVNSKAARYKRISDMWLSLACSFIPLFAVLISTGAIQVTAFVKPKLLYYTPGLWEMSGSQFWRSFLFETPFAVMRGFSWAVIPIMILVYAAFAYKAKKEYMKSQQG
ncbi:hypothetical protein CM49_04524 [Paenibacillus sp. P1XP2]|nr:hypothetical protein CM49_04524 [Paenibacillus sp. P1XP2]